MENPKFEYTFKSDITAVTPVIGEIMGFIRTKIPNICEAHEFELRLVFSELLFNSVIHGNESDTSRSVGVAVEINRALTLVSASVKDEGVGYDYRRVIHAVKADGHLTEENGRGLLLVTGLTDAIEFGLGGNTVKFHKKVARDG